MILVIVIPVTLLVAALAGRPLLALGALRFTALWLVALAVLAQIPARSGQVDPPVGGLLTSLSYGLLIVFALLNRRLPGMKIFLIGLVANALVIVANGGYMPVAPTAFRQITGLTVEPPTTGAPVVYRKSRLVPPEESPLAWLGDWIATPLWPVRGLLSPGDLLIAAGVAWLLWQATARPRERSGDASDAPVSASQRNVYG